MPEPVAAPTNPLTRWLLQGNPIAKLGVLLLLFGLAYLLRFANERGWLPIELRLSGAAMMSMALLGLGWRLRASRPVYALTLQGGSIGALYVTSFAAFRVYGLLPHGLVFALLVVICAASVTLAVVQRAQSLAVLASLGGYLAPILLSTGEGNHVALFTYYAILSSGILAVSVWRAWRPLNLVGFAFTFGVGTFWGVNRYQPGLYPECQFFLALNLLIYGVLEVLMALRHTKSPADAYVDGTLAFGTPIIGFGLQVGLTQQWKYGSAFSALAFGALYLPLARFTLWRWKERAQRVTLTFLALGGGFVTLAIPLALSARWTSMAWALEGAGILWMGRRQRHSRMSWSGTGVLVLAAGSAWVAWDHGLDTSTFLLVTGTLSLAWLGGAWLWHDDRHDSAKPDVSTAFLVGSVATWLFLLADGSHRLIDDDGPAALLALLVMSGTALAWTALAARVSWSALRESAAVLWPFAFVVLAIQWDADQHPVGSGWWSTTWLVALASSWIVLRQGRAAPDAPLRPLQHAAWGWLLFAVAGLELWWRLKRLGWGQDEWLGAGLITLCATFILIVWRLTSRRHWAPVTYPRTYWIAWLLPALVIGGLSLVAANLLDGASPGRPYIPLLNPIELAAAYGMLMAIVWATNVRLVAPGVLGDVRVLVGALAVWWLNGLFLRTIAMVGGVSWQRDALWQSALVQTSMAIVWTVAALIAMALAAKRANRALWFSGATALGVVVVKLFLVDAARTSGIARAVAFIGVALLILLIGYLAPLPPRDGRTGDTST